MVFVSLKIKQKLELDLKLLQILFRHLLILIIIFSLILSGLMYYVICLIQIKLACIRLTSHFYLECIKTKRAIVFLLLKYICICTVLLVHQIVHFFFYQPNFILNFLNFKIGLQFFKNCFLCLIFNIFYAPFIQHNGGYQLALLDGSYKFSSS